MTHLLPKALCPVGNRPLVDHAIDRVARHAAEVAVNVHAHTERMVAHLGSRVHVSVEHPVALGTAGAIGRLRRWINGRGALVTNADAWVRDDLSELVSGWDGRRVRLLVVHDPTNGDFGEYRYAGACLLPWSWVVRMPTTPSGLYEVCWRIEQARGRLDLSPTTAAVIDCGTPADYLAANMEWSGGENVIGPGALVAGRVRRSVVWPDGVVGPDEDLVQVIRAGRDVTVAVR